MTDLSNTFNSLKPQIKQNYVVDIFSEFNEADFLEKLAQNYEIYLDELEVFSSLDSAVYSLFRFLDLNHCTIYSPCSDLYKKTSVLFTYELRLINRFENSFLPVKEGSLIVFMNPSLPDGTYYDLDMLIDYWIEKHCTILIDERFLEFCDGKSAKEYLDKYDKLYILKSFDLFYSLKSLHTTTLISNSDNIQKLKRFEPSKKVSKLDANYIEDILKDKNFKTITRAVTAKNRFNLEKTLKEHSYVHSIYHSSTNFLLIKLKEIDSLSFTKKLLDEDVKIYDAKEYDFLDDSFVSIKVGSLKENEILKKALEKIC